MRNKWIAAIQTHQQFDYFSTQFEICEAHFDESDFIVKSNKRALKTDAVPTKFPEPDNNENASGRPSVVSR